MTDWLTPEQRAELMPHEDMPKKLTHLGIAASVIERFAAHAAEADRRLAERDDVIRELAEALRGLLDDPLLQHTVVLSPSTIYPAERALARVDAMTGGER